MYSFVLGLLSEYNMDNPWMNIKCKTSEYIADCDRSESLIYDKFDFTMIPHPYMGDPINSEIFLLNGNPNDGGNHRIFTKEHREVVLKNLEHGINDYPLYGINDEFKNYFVFKWWHKKLFPIIQKVKNSKRVSKNIFVAEYLPYFSDKYIQGIRVPSQGYTLDIINKAIANGKMIIIMRARRDWESSIPKLKDYCNKFVLRNPQNVIISPGNMDDGVFEELVKRIK